MRRKNSHKREPAGSLTYIGGYAVLLNTLPDIADGSADPDIARGCHETLVRHVGVLEDAIKTSFSGVFCRYGK